MQPKAFPTLPKDPNRGKEQQGFSSQWTSRGNRVGAVEKVESLLNKRWGLFSFSKILTLLYIFQVTKHRKKEEEKFRFKKQRERGPAGALDIFHELGNDVVAQVTTKVARVELHVPLQYYVEEHLSCLLFLFSLVLFQFTKIQNQQNVVI